MRILLALVAVVVAATPARAGDLEDLAAVLDHQAALATDASVYAPDARIVATQPDSQIGSRFEPDRLGGMLDPTDAGASGTAAKDRQVAIARDGKSAWASFTTTVTVGDDRKQLYRVSDALVRTPKGWRAVATAWTYPVDNAVANAEAKAKQRGFGYLELATAHGEAALVAAFAKLATDGLDAAASARKDLVVIGSGPGERTIGGGGFAKAWAAAWVKHVKVDAAIGELAPSGTTGWVIATIRLGKPTYDVAFLVFAVFDKTAAGAWSLTHLHLAV